MMNKASATGPWDDQSKDWIDTLAMDALATPAASASTRVEQARHALAKGALTTAGALLQKQMQEQPNDAYALALLGHLSLLNGRPVQAEALLRRALGLAPTDLRVHVELYRFLHKQRRDEESVAALRQALELAPGWLPLQKDLAEAHAKLNQHEQAIEVLDRVLAQDENSVDSWLRLAESLVTVGDTERAIRSFRRAQTIKPTLGGPWWSLSNVKSFRFSANDMTVMRGMLDDPQLAHEDRLLVNFALGKAHEDAAEPAAAFACYNVANALRRAEKPFDMPGLVAFLRGTQAVATADFFEQCGQAGCGDEAPIFVLGMPRAGSTLVEQILASHSRVEGTRELHILHRLLFEYQAHPAPLREVPADQLHSWGERFLAEAAPYRKTNRPFFIDKSPDNWRLTAAIMVVLPRAKLVDVRRHPLSCGYSNFRQHYPGGFDFAYSQQDIGQYYAEYVRFMAHMDRVQPGRVHRVVYESLVENTEQEVRALLAYCGLDFEPTCLAFHTTRRAVATPSAEQVRRPINRDGMDGYIPFEPWLGPLKEALGPVLTHYPQVPPGW